MDLTDYFSGKSLYGDNFTIKEIEQWYKDEEEAYANLYGTNASSDGFDATNLDILFGYKHLPNKKFTNVLGFGASWGYELLPIIDKFENISIVDSDETFDLITCFSVLHHIPNVTFVVLDETI